MTLFFGHIVIGRNMEARTSGGFKSGATSDDILASLGLSFVFFSFCRVFCLDSRVQRFSSLSYALVVSLSV